ncbi:hypothetical protein [Frankia sp. CiP3]|uniref:hypothetical protein n=1 Tax=Frankia sp. CiP3 TaxID=2880971 RepID=UPI001EF538CA|nr:hypothetical protein [Frankia sp. CiP3]
MHTPPVDFDELRTELRRALRHGARARSLLDHPTLVDVLCPVPTGADRHVAERALEASNLIAQAVDALDSPVDRIMSIMLCLRTGTSGMTLSNRRRHAADVLEIQPVTFRSERRYEQAFVTELALEIYRRIRGLD